MNIITNKNCNLSNFEELKLGTPFEWRGCYFMKIEPCTAVGLERNAVDLKSGGLVYFDNNYKISIPSIAVHVCE